MRSRGPRPQLLVDVDGVVSLFGFPGPPPAGVIPAAVDGIPHFLSAHAGPLLARLSDTFDCAWCTGWEERAEEHLPRLLGLPGGWPHLTFLKVDKGPARHWKLDAVASWAGPDRPLAWIDDAFDATCEAWAPDGPGRRCWSRPSRPAGCRRPTSRAWRPGRGRSEPEHRQLGQRPQAQRQAGRAEAGGDEQVPALLDHVRAKVPVAVARR